MPSIDPCADGFHCCYSRKVAGHQLKHPQSEDDMTFHHGSLQCLPLTWLLSPAHEPIPGAAGTNQWPIQAGNNSHMNFTEINLYPKINRYLKTEMKITLVIFHSNLCCLKTEWPPQTQGPGTVKPPLQYSSCTPDNLYCTM